MIDVDGNLIRILFIWIVNTLLIFLVSQYFKLVLWLFIGYEYMSLKKYSTTLGHKWNHNFDFNAQFWSLFHPKFGDIMWVEAAKDIKRGQEVEIDYGFRKGCGPKWYKEVVKERKRQIKLKEKEKENNK